ncbi:MAG: WecB/TagA/CpsF family glycosyltransferase [Endomicrobiia bacterium]
MFVYEINGIKIFFSKDFNETIKLIDTIITETKNPCQITTLNTLIYYQTKKDFETYLAVKNSKLVIADSFGITFFVNIFNFKFFKRQPGIELIDYLCLLSKRKNYKIYLLGSTKEVVSKTKFVLEKKYLLEICGAHHGYFLNSQNLTNEVIKDINAKSVDILLVGLPTEIQEKWIFKNLNKLNCRIVIGVGGSFDVISGKIPRAPRLFQIIGLEWYYRLLIQPSRIKRILKLPLAMIFLFFDFLKNYFNKFNFKYEKR